MKTCLLIVALFIGASVAQPELSRAIEFVNSGNYNEANKLIDTYLKTNADDHQGAFIKALVLTNYKDFGNAIPYIEKAISLKNDRAEYYKVAAQLYEALQDTKSAINAWEKCRAFAKDSKLFTEAKNHLEYLKNK